MNTRKNQVVHQHAQSASQTAQKNYGVEPQAPSSLAIEFRRRGYWPFDLSRWQVALWPLDCFSFSALQLAFLLVGRRHTTYHHGDTGYRDGDAAPAHLAPPTPGLFVLLASLCVYEIRESPSALRICTVCTVTVRRDGGGREDCPNNASLSNHIPHHGKKSSYAES